MIDRVCRFYTTAKERYGPTGSLLLVGLTVAVILLARYLVVGEKPLTLSRTVVTEPTIHQRIASGVWWGDLVVTVVLLVLLALGGFWARRMPESRVRVLERTRLRAGFFVGLGLAMIFGTMWRLPRLNHSLFNDEEMALRKYIMGQVIVNPETEEVEQFRKVKWERTLFYNLSGQNHTAQSIVSRWSNKLWTEWTHAEPGEFSEAALRVPSLLAGIATIGMMGFWLGRSGSPVGGLAAAWILAMHPWHIRYSVEARGYSLMMLAIMVAFFCLRPALKTASWRYWLGFGVAQALILLSFAGALFLVVPLNFAILFYLVKDRDRHGAWRWIFVSVCGASAVIFFLFPAITNFMGWLGSLNETQRVSEFEYLREFWSHLVLGIPWPTLNPEFEYGIGVTDLMERGLLEKVVILIVIPLVALIGASVALAKSPVTRVFVIVMLIDVVMVDVYRQLTETPFHLWYAIYAVLWFAIALASFCELPQVVKVQRNALTMRYSLAVLVVVIFGWISWTPRQLMAKHPRHPMREAVVEARGAAPALEPTSNMMTAAIGPGAKQMISYDPRVVTVKTADELLGKIETARMMNKTLVIYAVGPVFGRELGPEIYQLLDDERVFTKGKYVEGIEAFWSVQIYRMK